MKMRTIIGLLLIISLATVDAQSFRGLDKSPMDIAYFPDNYAHDRREGEKAIIRVIYSRPQKNNRDIMGNTVEYGKVWRTGANEATEIKIYQGITIGGKSLAAGTYSLFSIPNESDWTLIFNSDLDYWGSYSYDETKDVLRVPAKVSQAKKTIEAFMIQFEANGDNKGVMRLAWDDTIAEVGFSY